MAQFSCFVIGEGVVALKCLQILAPHQILGIYSNDQAIAAWALAHNLSHITSRRTCEELLLTAEYDYLFSINNNWIIPSAVIARAGQATINYHNSPLPKYAGLNATSWAILNGEIRHAVTWHEVVATVDAGNILKQPSIPIAPDDTALSLNLRCVEAAVAAFQELVVELAEARAIAVAQDLSQRSYFSLSHRPEAACVLSFQHCTSSLYNLVRALDFGPTRNPLGLPKLWLPGGAVAVKSARPRENTADAADAQPGQVLSLEPDGLSVATYDGALYLSQSTTLAGQPLSAEALSQQYGVQVGTVLPPLSIQMQAAISQHDAAISRYETEWVKRLEQFAPFVPFVHPYLQCQSANPKSTSALYHCPIDLPDLANAVANAAMQQPHFLLSVFAAYCVRLAAEPVFDLALQTPAQCSVAPELFAQTVPLRLHTQEDESFRQFQQRVTAELLDLANRKNYCLDVFARYPTLCDRFHPLSTAIVLAESPEHFKFNHLNVAIAFVAYEDGSTPELVHSGVLDCVYAQAIVQQLQCLIATCLQQPQQPLHTLPLLPQDEQQRILVDWNQTATPYPSDRCLHELIAEQAARTPDAIAVCYGEAQLSYQELDRRSNQLAHCLAQLDIKPDTLVALCLPRSLELIIGLLAILKVGGAYVPIDPTYPAERIAYLLEDSCPQGVVTTTKLRDHLFGQTKHVVCIDAVPDQTDSSAISTAVAPTNLAYVIYTSGSTGKPKGVEIEHRSVINHSWAMANLYELGVGDRVLQSASISFDVAAEQIYPALLRGATVVVRPEDLLESFERFRQFVQLQSITALILPTAFWHEWVADLMASGRTVPGNLRMLSVGTEKVLSSRLEQWQNLSANVTFFQGYGPTEATITCTLYRHKSPHCSTAVPIGRPLPNTEVYLLDSQLQPVPIGVVGELYVGGDGLARGYHRRPELTSQCFIPHPFRRNAQLYKTGDLARFEPNGQIVYCNRIDHQIKLHGFRIELGEIEAVLNEHVAVKQAIVQPQPSAKGQRLVAYVVLQPQQQSTVEHLQAFLQQTLPNYMQPAVIMPVEALPLTPSGKVNRQALPLPTQAQPLGTVAPRDALEQQLVQMWRLVLDTPDIGIRDNFFDLGGSSLSAIRLVDQIQAKFRRDLPLAAIFQFPTVEQFANLLRQTESPTDWSAVVAIQPVQPGGRLPLFLFQGVELYCPLARHLGKEQPVYGLSLELGKEIGSMQIEQLAAHYIQEIQMIQPQGPYLLGGASFGGMVAFEVAHQLRSSGQTVALLALFDTFAPAAYTLKPLAQRLLGHSHNLFKYGLPYLQEKLTRRLHWMDYTIAQLQASSKAPSRALSKAPSKVSPKQNKFVIETYRQLLLQYQPQVYVGDMALFIASSQNAAALVCDPALVDIDPTLGWQRFVDGKLETYPILGDHLSILKEPQVPALAQQLKTCIERALLIET